MCDESVCILSGLTPLVPYLAHTITEEVQKALKSLPQLRLLLKVLCCLSPT